MEQRQRELVTAAELEARGKFRAMRLVSKDGACGSV